MFNDCMNAINSLVEIIECLDCLSAISSNSFVQFFLVHLYLIIELNVDAQWKFCMIPILPLNFTFALSVACAPCGLYIYSKVCARA